MSYFIVELGSYEKKVTNELNACVYTVQLAKMISLGSNATIRDLAGFYTFELITETDIAGVQRNIFQVNRNSR